MVSVGSSGMAGARLTRTAGWSSKTRLQTASTSTGLLYRSRRTPSALIRTAGFSMTCTWLRSPLICTWLPGTQQRGCVSGSWDDSAGGRDGGVGSIMAVGSIRNHVGSSSIWNHVGSSSIWSQAISSSIRMTSSPMPTTRKNAPASRDRSTSFSSAAP